MNMQLEITRRSSGSSNSAGYGNNNGLGGFGMNNNILESSGLFETRNRFNGSASSGSGKFAPNMDDIRRESKRESRRNVLEPIKSYQF